MSYTRKGGFQYESSGDYNLPDVIYYNASIVNNNTQDTTDAGAPVQDPQIRFNETRDTAIIKDADKYQFSVVRFTVNGAGQDLPLFIPQIQQGTGQTDVNLTEYGFGFGYNGTASNWTVANSQYNSSGTTNVPGLTYIQYTPEIQNTTVAPIPRSSADPNYVGIWSSSAPYTNGAIVQYATAAANSFYQFSSSDWSPNPLYNTGVFVYYNGLAYQSVLPNQNTIPTGSLSWSQYYTAAVATWAAPTTYAAGVIVVSSGVYYLCIQAVTVGNTITLSNTAYWSPTAAPTAAYPVPTSSSYWASVSSELGTSQDLSTKYYYVFTYTHFINLINTQLQTAWVAFITQLGLTLATYPKAPQIVWNPTTGLFSILYAPYFLPPANQTAGVGGAPQFFLFMNANMEGLFSNFATTLLNMPTPTATQFPVQYPPAGGTPLPDGFAYVMSVKLKPTGTNIIAPTTTTSSGMVLPWGTLWAVEVIQDYASTSTLWSPIDGIVFGTALLPVQNEQQAPPMRFGAKNVGNSTATAQSAFAPILTDVSLDLGNDPQAYRQFINYNPSAEYRMSDFTTKTDIRSIDVSVFWRNRLDNALYPMTMYNLASVSFKLMFRKKK
jgi:hypothetical protein